MHTKRQMEFCEKSTLVDCIDNGLYQDVDRVWRLFREIIEGLVHIHEQVFTHFMNIHSVIVMLFDIVC